MSSEDVEAYFLLLQGEGGDGLDGLVSAAKIRRVCRELQLDTSVRGFCDDNLEQMIDMFDQGGKGAISLGDFRSIVKHACRGGGAG
jgi:Ca2+-binding EF-hand superfamily protein